MVSTENKSIEFVEVRKKILKFSYEENLKVDVLEMEDLIKRKLK